MDNNEDDYAEIEHQLEKQRQLEQQKRENKRLTGENFVAQMVLQQQAAADDSSDRTQGKFTTPSLLHENPSSESMISA